MNPDTSIHLQFEQAIKAGDLGLVQQLVEKGAEVNHQYDHGVTPVLLAAYPPRVDILRYLFSRGASADQTGFREGSPLMLAAYDGNLEMIALYLEHKADPNLAMPDGGETALHMAAVRNRTDAVILLLKHGANPNLHVNADKNSDMFSGGAKLWGETPLHFAASYGDMPMIEAMLAAGADKTSTNTHGERPLAYAGRHWRPKEIRTLLQ